MTTPEPVTSHLTELNDPTGKIRPVWRMCLGAIAFAMAGLAYVGYAVTHGIQGSVEHGFADFIFLMADAYVLLVALTGRWGLFKPAMQ